MKITIVMGFFLPMPPDAGGATEKSWNQLAIEFARLGHEVTIISRRWSGWPDAEMRDGVRHLRLEGYNHTSRLWRNLLRDLRWSLRVFRHLPPADVTVVNCVALPLWLGAFRRHAGRLVVMPGRMPKGQFRRYGKLDSILAVSNTVRQAILRENPRLDPIIHLVGYPIDWQGLAQEPRPSRANDPSTPLTIGFVGRLHREKGVDLLVEACELLAKRDDLPPWRVILCGPRDVAQGGSGETFAVSLERRLQRIRPGALSQVLPPIFQAPRLYSLYREIDVFCYPSIAARGETFGVAVAEAMATGAIPVVSDLPCFRDFVHDGKNGLAFQYATTEAAQNLADCLTRLLLDADLRQRMAAEARDTVYRYDFPLYASRLLADFATLVVAGGKKT